MGMPAARIGDLHVCPMVTGVVPHVGGPILPPCEPTVLTGGMPQARIGDMLTCVGPPDIIALGAFTLTMDALPGSPQIQNLIPTRYFGTDAYAAPVAGSIGGVCVLLGGLLWLDRARARAAAGGHQLSHPARAP